MKLIECVRARPALWHRKHLRQRVQVAHRGWEEIRKAFKATEVASLKVRWKTLRDSFRREVKRIEDGEIGGSSWPLFERMSFLIGHFRTRESYYKSGSLSPEQAKSMEDDVWKYSANGGGSGSKYGSQTEEEGRSRASLGESENEVMEAVSVYSNSLKPGVYETIASHGGRGSTEPADSDPEDLTMVETLETVQGEEEEEMETARSQDVIEVLPQVYGEVTFKNKLRARIKTEPVEVDRTMVERSGLIADSDYSFLMSLHPFMRKLSGKRNLSVRIQIQQLIAEAMEED